MNWDARQRAMLEAMGLRVWTPASAPDAGAMADEAPAVDVAPAPVPSPAPEVSRPAVAARPPVQAPVAQPVAAPTSDPARAARIALLDEPALREDAAACRACGLCESRKQTVFGVGNERAHWMIVGEAPGEQEDLRGEPFVGTAGQLLDNMLRALGLARSEGTPDKQVYICNTLKCRPPRNRNPEPAELDACEPYLMRQIALVQPRIILAMGRFAVQQLLRSNEAIGRLRGRVHTYQGVPLIVTYHPAYLLRNLADKALAWDDLCLAREVYESTGTGA